MTADKARRAAELMRDGVHLKEIAKELGYKGTSGVSMLIRRYIRELPRQALEDLQKWLLVDLEMLQAMAMKDAEHKDPIVRDRAQRRIATCIEKRARIAGLIKSPPPMIVIAPPREMDLSRLSIEQIEALRGIQETLHDAPRLGQGESNESRQERDERIIDVEPEGPDAT